MKQLSGDLVEQITNDRAVRQEVTRKNPLLFFSVYLAHHVEFAFAPMHLEMFHLMEMYERYHLVGIMAFRGSGKSTIMNLGYTLWSVVGKPRKRFVVIVSQTLDQAKSHFANIRRELEGNRLLKEDLGPFLPEESEGGFGIELTRLSAKILCVSRQKSVRGLLYGTRRPDLVIVDDLEDSSTADKTGDREKTWQWFTNEVLPLGGSTTNIVVLGNLLHEDSFLMRIKAYAESRSDTSVFRTYPLVDDKEQSLWPDKFPLKEIERLRAASGTEVWELEYCLLWTPRAGLHAFMNMNERDPPIIQHPLLEAMEPYTISAPRESWTMLIELVRRLDAENQKSDDE